MDEITIFTILMLCASGVATYWLDLEEDDDEEEEMYKHLKNLKGGKVGTCDICYNVSDLMGYVLNCGHDTFCKECLLGLHRPVCPLCRAPIISVNTC